MKDYKDRLRAFMVDRQPKAEAPPVDIHDDGVAIIRLYDPVDSWGEFWGVSAKEFATVLDELPDNITEIRLHVNSPGGDVFDGIAILNALRNHDARVVAVVDGIAASAASFIAAGSDELVMARNSELMIHDAWGLCVGNAADMRRLAEDLERVSNNLASIYAEKAGGTTEEWRALMEAETWYSAEEAVASGLADRIDEAKDGAKNSFDLSIFNYAGRDEAPDPIADSTAVELPTSTDDQGTDPGHEAAAPAAQAADAPAEVPADEPQEDGEGDDLELRARALGFWVDAVA